MFAEEPSHGRDDVALVGVERHLLLLGKLQRNDPARGDEPSCGVKLRQLAAFRDVLVDDQEQFISAEGEGAGREAEAGGCDGDDDTDAARSAHRGIVGVNWGINNRLVVASAIYRFAPSPPPAPPPPAGVAPPLVCCCCCCACSIMLT